MVVLGSEEQREGEGQRRRTKDKDRERERGKIEREEFARDVNARDR